MYQKVSQDSQFSFYAIQLANIPLSEGSEKYLEARLRYSLSIRIVQTRGTACRLLKFHFLHFL